MRYGCYIIYTNTKRDMVAILFNQHKTQNKQNAIWLLYYVSIWLLNKHKTQYGCYII